MAHRVFVISDTHFGHEMLVNNGYRPSGFEGLVMKRVEGLGLDEMDVIYHLGDVALGVFEGDYHRRFAYLTKAHTVLIRGNHDKRSTGWYLEKGWGAVMDAAVLNVFGYRILLSHEPVDVGRSDMFDVNIHGHLHNNLHRNNEFPFLGTLNILYSLEKFQYNAVPLKTLLKGI